MRAVLDIHCHTVASGHAYSTVNENAAHALKIGLEMVGVADHGPAMPGAAHLYYFGNLHSLPEEINGLRLLKGVEANIMDTSGKLDLPDGLLERLDFVIASAHGGCLAHGDIAANTQAYVSTAENPYVNILGHPGDPSYPIDPEAVVAAAKRGNTAIEINHASLTPGAHRYGGDAVIMELLAYCKRESVPVIAASDAHVDINVGRFDLAWRLIEASGIREDLVLNTSTDLLLSFLDNKKNKRKG